MNKLKDFGRKVCIPLFLIGLSLMEWGNPNYISIGFSILIISFIIGVITW